MTGKERLRPMETMDHQQQAEPFGKDCGAQVSHLANGNSQGINGDRGPLQDHAHREQAHRPAIAHVETATTIADTLEKFMGALSR